VENAVHTIEKYATSLEIVYEKMTGDSGRQEETIR
jgi:hypothetical protein